MAKKILFVVHSMGVGGVERLLVNIANGLVKRGHDITVAVTSRNLKTASLFDPAVKVIGKDEPQFPLLRKLPYFRNFYEPGMWSRRKSPAKLYRYFVGTKDTYDVENAFFFGRPLKTVYGSPNRQSKKILWVHSDYAQSSGWATGFWTKDEARTAFHWFDRCFLGGTSRLLKQGFTEATGRTDGIVSVPNLNNVEEIQTKAKMPLEISKTGFTFVSVGRLSEEKGFDRLLEAVKRLNDENYTFSLWLVGDGSERERLTAYKEEHNLHNVTLLGNQDNPYPYIQNADMFVCPSRHEAYGLVIAEAFILKKPVMATQTAASEEHLGGGEFGSEVENSTDGIYNGMKAILDDPALYERYCAAAEKGSTRYDPNAVLDTLEKLFEEA